MYSYQEFFYVVGMIGLGVFLSDVLHSCFRYALSIYITKRLMKKYQKLAMMVYPPQPSQDVLDIDPIDELPPSKVN